MGMPFQESSRLRIVSLSMLAQAPVRIMASAAAAAGAVRRIAVLRARRAGRRKHEAGMGDSAAAHQGAKPLDKRLAEPLRPVQAGCACWRTEARNFGASVVE
ncbi:hypothetical protein GCM10027081_34940 [Cupriavidus yeoncheonensis]